MNKKVIHSVFEDVATRLPSQTAVATEEGEIGYAALNEYANRIAHLLEWAGCGRAMIVHVAMPSSIQLIGALLGVFKRGAIYLPVDLGASEKRLRQLFDKTSDGYIITDTVSQDVITGLAAKFPIAVHRLIVLRPQYGLSVYSFIDGDWRHIPFHESAGWKDNPPLTVDGNDSNYIFYTSGSTGEAKAIEGAHAGLSHFIHWEIGELGIDASFRVSQLTQMAFDASLRDIFVALISGSTLYIPTPEIRNNPRLLLEWLEQKKISLLHCVPSMLRILIREMYINRARRYELDHLQYVLLAGELLYAKDIRSWREVAGDHMTLVNLYGPTETTLVKTFYRIGELPADASQSIPVGQAISNTSIAIIREGQICKTGEIGEIYIKTPFATKGYYRDEALTNENFVQNPLIQGERDIVYRTGDLGRYLPDMNIEVTGRVDYQVKVNGIRVELREVEKAMLEQTDITGAIAVAHSTEDQLVTLAGYYTGKEIDAEELRKALEKALNRQAIPSRFIHMEQFPLNRNGKVDRNALPPPGQIAVNAADTEYLNEYEVMVADMWKEILKTRKIGRNESFFISGGNSIRAIQLLSRIHKRFGVSLKIAEIFKHTTIREMADLISTAISREFNQIRPCPEQSSYTVSRSQRRLWVMSQFEEGNIAYNMPGSYIFEGELDFVSLDRSFQTLIQRHESLRTVFRTDENGEIRQLIRQPQDSGFTIGYEDVRSRPEDEVRRLIRTHYRRPFNLAQGPLLRVSVYRVEDRKWIFTYVMHHIISDGWSMVILIDEILYLYNAYARNEAISLKPMRIQYKDFATWQNEQLSGAALEAHKAYWVQQFEGNIPVLELPSDRPRPAMKTYNGMAISKKIGQDITEGLRKILRQEESTLFMGLLAALDILFYRYTHQDDIVIGSPVAGRDHVDLEDQIGFYVNTLALRTRFKGEHTYRQLLKIVREVTIGAYEHQIYPFDELVGNLPLRRDVSRNPLFDFQLNVHTVDFNRRKRVRPFDDMNVSGYRRVIKQSCVFDMVFSFAEIDEGLNTVVTYNSDIYDEDTVTQLADDLAQILKKIIAAPDRAIDRLDFLSEDTRHRLLTAFNDNAIIHPAGKTLVSLLREQVARTPDKIAVVFNNRRLTYRALDEQSARLAQHLTATSHIGAGDLAGILLHRSDHMIIAILGILRAGAAYVPIDPEYPPARKKFIIEDSGIKALITQSEWIFDLDDYKGSLVAIDIQLDSLTDATNSGFEDTPHGTDATPADPRPGDLAYVIYTSGSTGKPKGVMIEHRAVVNTILAQQSVIGAKEDDHHLQFASASFDASVWEIFIALTSGGCLFIIDEETKKNPALFHQYIRSNKIDMATLPPAYCKMLQPEDLRTLSKLVTAGEAANPGVALAFSATGMYYNAYGPTEAAICATIFALAKGQPLTSSFVPIGATIPNVRIYILDEHRQLMPMGAVGEMAIGGAGLARGYANNSGLTEQQFIPDPFREDERIYLTGDLGRWLRDGTIVFCGRKDEQVKIRGFRVEPGEIEQVLLSFPGVKSTAVHARPNRYGESELIAYLVSERTMHIPDIRTFLEKELPYYLHPAHFVLLESLPLTPNGKIDRGHLPDPAGFPLNEQLEYVPPGNDIERGLADIWQEVLDQENIGIFDDYFALGGNSLKAMVVIKKVMDRMGYTLSIQTLFEERNIAGVAKVLAVKHPDPAPDTDNDPVERLPERISYNQLNYFSPWKMGVDSIQLLYSYNNLDIPVFESALNLLIRRHEILRTQFIPLNGTIMQQVLPAEKCRLTLPDAMFVSSMDELRKIIAEEDRKGIDLYSYPLLFVSLYRQHGDKYYILFRFHHSITDGYSSGVLKDELTTLYMSLLQKTPAELQPLPFQYRDFTAWQTGFLASAEGSRHRAYWLDKLHGFDGPVSKISHAGPATRLNHDAIRIQKTIDGQLFERLDQFARVQGLTKPAILLGVLVLFGNRLSGMDDITITSMTSGRSSIYYGDLDVSRLIGLFVNVLLIRNRVDPDRSVIEFLLQVQRNFLGDLSHSAYPFFRLIGEFPDMQPASMRHFGFFNYHNYDYCKESIIKVSEEARMGIAEEIAPIKRDYGLTVEENYNCLQLELKIDADALPDGQQLYFSLLKQVLDDPQCSVGLLATEKPEPAAVAQGS